MKKGTFGIIMVLCLALVLIAGCGGPSKQVTPPAPELLTNGDFETGALLPWASSNPAMTVSISSDSPHGGTYCALTSGRTQPYQTISQDVTTILNNNGPGMYQIQGYVKLVSGQHLGIIQVGIQDDASGQLPAINTKNFTVTTEWTKISDTVNLSWSGKVTGTWFGYVDQSSDATPSVNYYMDDFSLKKVSN